MSATTMTTFPGINAIAGGALIASASSQFREQVMGRLKGRCRPVQQAVGGADALAKLEHGDWQMLFLDRRVPDLDTGELIAIIERRFAGVQVVLLDSDTGPALETAEASHPFPFATDERQARREGGQEWKTIPLEPLPGMIGRSEAMRRVYRMARLVAPRTTTVLVAGPTGSGKELVARALHLLSPRVTKAFIAVNCAAIPEALLESELFGYARGAFTGALQAQAGRVAAAHGGTLFLDEVSELPLGMQAKLLRFLEQKEVQRLGAPDVSRVDVRVVAASNVDLAVRVGRGQFREDLFYRLCAFPLELPPLAERREDIVPLAEHFLACMATAIGGRCPNLSGEAVQTLESYSWKGNVRELQHVMERASILLQDGDMVLSEHLYFPFQGRHPDLQPPGCSLSCSSLAS
jgi:DNA-binding NtrC family response regulator